MSLIHWLHCGHFTDDAIRSRTGEVVRPLDARAVDEAIARHPEVPSSMVQRGDSVVVVWHGPGRVEAREALVRDIAKATGCQVADLRHALPLDPVTLEVRAG